MGGDGGKFSILTERIGVVLKTFEGMASYIKGLAFFPPNNLSEAVREMSATNLAPIQFQ